jgi:hypothetical protein
LLFRFGVKIRSPLQLPDDILSRVIELAKQSLELHPDPTRDNDGAMICKMMKLTLDKEFGVHWHVMVGNDFGSLVTYHKQRKYINT